jgi:predicted lipid-binding transport protein (Tim44 family)
MKQLISALTVAFVALAFVVEDAEARRLGGGRSFGAQRQSVAPSRSAPQTPPSQTAAAAPAAGSTPAAAPKPAGNRWLGPIAGIAAGLGLGWLIGQNGMGGLLILVLIGFAVALVMRTLLRPKAADGMQYAGVGDSSTGTEAPALTPSAGAAPDFGARLRPNIPAGFDSAGFLRQARLNFIKLQAVHDSG